MVMPMERRNLKYLIITTILLASCNDICPTKGPYLASLIKTSTSDACGMDVKDVYPFPEPCPSACICQDDFAKEDNTCDTRNVAMHCLDRAGDHVDQVCTFDPVTLIGQCTYTSALIECGYTVIL